jgi:hypothetical protein
LLSLFRVNPASFEQHPKYDSKTHDFDYAIITLEQPIAFDYGAAPICLAGWEETYFG